MTPLLLFPNVYNINILCWLTFYVEDRFQQIGTRGTFESNVLKIERSGSNQLFYRPQQFDPLQIGEKTNNHLCKSLPPELPITSYRTSVESSS